MNRRRRAAAAGGGGFSDTFTTPVGLNPHWTITLAGPGAYVDNPSGELRLGTSTGSFGVITASCKRSSSASLASSVNGIIWQWTGAIQRGNDTGEVNILDAGGNGLKWTQLSGGGFEWSLSEVVAGTPTVIAFQNAGTLGLGTWFRLLQVDATHYSLSTSPTGLPGSWTVYVTRLYSGMGSVNPAALFTEFLGLANGGSGLPTETRFDNYSET